MDIILLVGIIIYLIITAYTGYAAIEKLKGNELSEEKRIQRYRFSFLWNVVSGGVVMLLIVMGPATLEETGFRPIRFLQGSHRYLVFATWILCGLLSAVFIFQIAVFLMNPSYRGSVSKQIEEKTHSGKVYVRVVNGLIPRTRREKSYFVATALAAGICEEIVFRGFLLYVLIRIFPELSPFLLAALAGVCFGAAHFYQGIKGVIKTGLLGILFGFLYISTGSLYLCMAVHFLFDISAAFLCEEDKYEV